MTTQQAARQALHIAVCWCPDPSWSDRCWRNMDCWKDAVEHLLGLSTASTLHAGGVCWYLLRCSAAAVIPQCLPAHAAVAVRLSQQGFEQFLLPSPQQRNMWHSRSRLWPDDNVLQPDAPTPSSFDDDVVDALVTEVRQVITSPKFAAAVLVSTGRLLETAICDGCHDIAADATTNVGRATWVPGDVFLPE